MPETVTPKSLDPYTPVFCQKLFGQHNPDDPANVIRTYVCWEENGHAGLCNSPVASEHRGEPQASPVAPEEPTQ